MTEEERWTRWAKSIPLMLALLLGAAPSGADFVIPADLENVEGGSLNSIPFSSAANQDSFRYQQLYGASEFPSEAVFEIQEIRFRPDLGTGFATTVTYPDLEVRLSTTSVSYSNISATFSENVTTIETQVFRGEVVLATEFIGPAEGPKAFDLRIPFDSSYFYEPCAGNLLIDFRFHSGASAGGTNHFDAQAGGTSWARVWTNPLDAGLNEPTGASGVGFGLVTLFVPEPGAGLMGLSSIATLLWLKRQQR
jgi:hypothetical protein